MGNLIQSFPIILNTLKTCQVSKLSKANLIADLGVLSEIRF